MQRVWLKIGTLAFWVCWPALYIYLRQSRRTRVVVRAGGQLLLVRTWLSDGFWGLPGGGIHRGEPKSVGAVRELREETGLNAPAEKLVELATEQLKWRGLRFTCTYFLVDIDEIGTVQRRRGEISDVQWFHVSEVGGEGFQPEVRRALKLLVAMRLF